MITRRSFLAALSCLPFVGKFIKRKYGRRVLFSVLVDQIEPILQWTELNPLRIRAGVYVVKGQPVYIVWDRISTEDEFHRAVSSAEWKQAQDWLQKPLQEQRAGIPL